MWVCSSMPWVNEGFVFIKDKDWVDREKGIAQEVKWWSISPRWQCKVDKWGQGWCVFLFFFKGEEVDLGDMLSMRLFGCMNIWHIGNEFRGLPTLIAHMEK